MKLFERIMRRMGWVREKGTININIYWDVANSLWDERMAHAETRKKLTGIAALTPEQRSARTAKGNRTRALRRELTNRPETKGAV